MKNQAPNLNLGIFLRHSFFDFKRFSPFSEITPVAGLFLVAVISNDFTDSKANFLEGNLHKYRKRFSVEFLVPMEGFMNPPLQSLLGQFISSI